MKLEKLLTLSQFIDEQNKKIGGSMGLASNFKYEVSKYNDFLKQPLTKEMFINPYGNKEPQNNYMSSQTWNYYQARLKEWQEAEKKVIFDGWTLRLRGDYTLFDNEELDIFIDLDDYETIYDLAEDFGGELTLKNVAI